MYDSNLCSERRCVGWFYFETIYSKTFITFSFVFHFFFVISAGNNPRGGGYSHTLPIRVCAAQRGRDFEAPDLERGIHFRRVL